MTRIRTALGSLSNPSKRFSKRRPAAKHRRRGLVESLEDRRLLAADALFLSPENSAFVSSLSVPPGGSIQLDSGGGVDTARFQLEPDGSLSFITPPDFELPGDADGDNVFEVGVLRTFASSATELLNICVEVIDVNEAPIANMGGPYEIDFGQPLSVDASGTSDPDAGDGLTYDWDFGGDGSVEFSSPTPTAVIPNATFANLTGVGDNPLALTVTDLAGEFSTASTTLTILPRFTFDIPGGAGASDFTLVRDGAEGQLIDTENGILFATFPADDIDELVINGSPDANELTIDFSGGPLPASISFDGADPIGGIGDSLVLTGDTADRINHNFLNESDGFVEIVGGFSGSSIITYLGLEPILDNLNATNREFLFLGGTETITLADDGIAGNNLSRIDSTFGEVVTFTNPIDSLLVNAGGGDDLILVDALDPDFAASLFLDGGTGVDTAAINSLTIDGSLAADGTPDAGLVLSRLNAATISDATLTNNVAPNGAGLLINGPTDVLITGESVITGNTADIDGGGIFASGGGTLTINDQTVVSENVAAAGDGGGIFNVGGIVDISGGSQITSNAAATDGGGIAGSGGTSLSVLASTISGNIAADRGGGIFTEMGTLTVSGTTLALNQSSGGGGGAIYSEAGIVELSDSDVSSNQATAAAGGGVLIVDGTATITAGQITLNQTATSGGGLFNDGGNVTATGTTFDQNLTSAGSGAADGGAIASVGGVITINGGAITSNIAAGDGGGIWAFETTLTIDADPSGDALIDGNEATNGGGIFISDPDPAAPMTSIGNTIISRNLASEEGGGIWNTTVALSISDSQLNENVASASDNAAGDQGGGAIFNTDAPLDITGTSLTGNRADTNDGRGGAILNFGGSLQIGSGAAADQVAFASNVAATSGGAIDTVAAPVTIINSVFGGPTIGDGNVAGTVGGAIAAGDVTTLSVVGTSLTNNAAGQDGGGIWISGDSQLQVTDSTSFGFNRAGGAAIGQGGGAIFSDGGDLDISLATFTDNEAFGAAGSGGAIFSGAGGQLTVVESTLLRNQANRAGGAIEVGIGQTATLMDTDLIQNVAGIDPPSPDSPGNGGGLHLSGDAGATIMGGTFEDNVAASEGGGIWNGAGVLTVTSTLADRAIIRGNTALGTLADQGGGGVFNSAGLATLTDIDLIGNFANDGLASGGGAFNDQGTLNVNGSIIEDNDRCALAFIRVSGDITGNTFSGNLGGNLCPLVGTDDEDLVEITDGSVSVILKADEGVNTDVLLYDAAVGPIEVQTFAGNDCIDIESTATANPFTIGTGSGNDEVNVSSDAITSGGTPPVGNLDGILGTITLIGGDQLADAAPALTAPNKTNVVSGLVIGDTLNIVDASSVDDNTYALAATTFQRTGVLPTAVIDFTGFETFDVETGSGSDVVQITSTAADSTTALATGPGGDAVAIATTGDGSILRVDGGSSADAMTLSGGGVGAGVELIGNAGNDTIEIESTGGLALVVGFGGGGADTFAVVAVSAVTQADLVGDGLTGTPGIDVFDIGNPLANVGSSLTGTLDQILGSVCVDGTGGTGGDLTADVTARHAPGVEETRSVTVTSGDQLFISDAATVTGQDYTIEPTRVSRASLINPIVYGQIEELVLRSTGSDDAVTVTSSVDATSLSLDTLAGDDTVSIIETGDGSLTNLFTGALVPGGASDEDVITVTATGDGSALLIDTDAGQAVPDADTLTILSRGDASLLEATTGRDADTVTLGDATPAAVSPVGVRSLLTVASGTAADDFTINEVFLETVVDLSSDQGNDTFTIHAAGSDAAGDLGRINDDPVAADPIVASTRELFIDGGDNDAAVVDILDGVDFDIDGNPVQPTTSVEVGDSITLDATSASTELDLRLALTDLGQSVLATTVPAANPSDRSDTGNEVWDAVAIEDITINSGSGNDILTVQSDPVFDIGGVGQRIRFDGGGSPDQIEVLGTASADSINVGPTTSDPANLIEIVDVSLLRVDGGAGGDAIANNTAATAVLNGETGDDVLLGGSGQDVISAGPGVDQLFGNDGNDLLFSDQNFGSDEVFAESGEILDGGEQGERPGDTCVQVGLDEVFNCEALSDGGAIKDVLTWLRANLITTDDVSFESGSLIFDPFDPIALPGAPLISTVEPSSVSPTAPLPTIDPPPPTPVFAAEDVNRDGQVTPSDALEVIMEISDAGGSSGIEGESTTQQANHADVNRDGRITPADALAVIVAMVEDRISTEGEAPAAWGQGWTAGEPSGDLVGTTKIWQRSVDRLFTKPIGDEDEDDEAGLRWLGEPFEVPSDPTE